jgi:polyisoprenoid-binding protein YceI
MKAAITAALFLGLAALAPAAWAAPAPNWTVDPSSKLGFRGVMGGDAFNGTFRRWSAQIAFDPKNLTGSKVVVSVDAASAVTGDADRDSALPTADWFDAAKFPKATFVTRSFRDLGGGKYEALGDLSLRGVTRPVALDFTLQISGDKAVMTGQTVLDRTAFGVGQGQWKAGDTLKPQVVVVVALSARQAR